MTGLMVTPGDPVALASALNFLLSNPDRAEQIATAGRADAEARFTVDAMVSGMTRYMEEITGT